jgi:hypothetical protein
MMAVYILTPIIVMTFQPVSIKNWSAWNADLQDKTPLKATSIPPMIRRRCSTLSKLSIEMASQALVNYNVDYVIFCSQHGDLSCTTQLINDICDQQTLSPTKFTQSVHNASSGLFSIIHNLQQNMTFISAGNDTFFMGLLEGLIWLQSHGNQSVLLVMADDYIPDMYQDLNIQNNNQYAVALLLTNEVQNNASFKADLIEKSKTVHADTPTALQFLTWWQQDSSSKFELASTHQMLSLQRVTA